MDMLGRRCEHDNSPCERAHGGPRNNNRERYRNAARAIVAPGPTVLSSGATRRLGLDDAETRGVDQDAGRPGVPEHAGEPLALEEAADVGRGVGVEEIVGDRGQVHERALAVLDLEHLRGALVLVEIVDDRAGKLTLKVLADDPDLS